MRRLLLLNNGLSFERFLRISLKFDSIGYMPYLRQILTSKPQKSSQNTSPLNFCDDSSFERLYRNLACGVATLVLNEFEIFALRQTIFASLCSQLQAEV